MPTHSHQGPRDIERNNVADAARLASNNAPDAGEAPQENSIKGAVVQEVPSHPDPADSAKFPGKGEGENKKATP